MVYRAFGIGVLLAALAWSYAYPRDNGQWQNTDPEIRQWYQSLMQPDVPTASCCGEADAYWCDDYTARGGKAYCTISDDRDDIPRKRPHIDIGTVIEIPPNKLKWGENDPQRAMAGNGPGKISFNPTGHSIIFLSSGNYVFCFVQPGGV